MSPGGHVLIRRGKRGPVWYGKWRSPDDRQHKKALGPAWTKRSRPPAGHLTRRDAEARLAEHLAAAGVPRAVGGVTFAQAVDEWLRYVEHDRQRAPSTLRDYRSVAERLKAELGSDTPLGALAVHDVERLRARELARVSPRTAQKHLVILHAIFARAVRRGLLVANPAARCERVTVRRSNDFTIIDPQDAELLARHAGPQDAELITVAFWTGLRLGELRALRWRDVDFANRLVHVRRNLPSGGVEREPKSGRVRSVPLTDQAARAFDALSRREHFTGDDDRVFVNTRGGPVDDVRLRRRFTRALEQAGLPPMRLHDLRHSFCSLAVRAFPLSDVKAYAGHADIATTMRYVHHVPQHDAAAKLSELGTKLGTELPILDVSERN